MRMFFRDMAYAARTLRKNPSFALTAIVTLALGIGATTAIFSVVNSVLLRPLPYERPDRLTIIWGELRTRKVYDWQFSPGDLKDLMDQATLFDGIAALNTGPAPLIVEGAPPQQVQIAAATPNVFTVLGVKIARGRNFTEDDGRPQPPPPRAAGDVNGGPQPAAPAGPPPERLPQVAVLSDGFWRRQYGADPSIIGKDIQLAFGPVHIVGILAPGAELLFPPKANVVRVPDVWLSLRLDYAADVRRTNTCCLVVARMKPTTTLSAAQQQVDRIAADLRARFAIKSSVDHHFRVESMKENVVSSVKPTIRALMGAVIFVLMIACANVANLLLVRLSGRDREMAVRSALGGSQWALTRQLLAESLVLAGAGGLLGLALAYVGIGLLLRLAPADLPRMTAVSMDPVVLAFAVTACVLSSVIFGLVPAVRASRPDLAEALRAGGRGATGGRATLLRRSVVMAEVALSFVLLVGCGLMIRSAIVLQHVNPGFDANGLLTMRLGNLRARTPEEAVAKTALIRERLSAVPGVRAVTAAASLPLENLPFNGRWGTTAAIGDPTKFRQGEFHVVMPGYFETMRGRLIAGRTFNASDDVPNGKTIIVDDRVAALAFPNESAVGKRLLARISTPDPETFEIVGVVAHQRHSALVGDEKESIYFSNVAQGNAAGAWIVRTDGDPAALIAPVRSALQQLDSQILVTNMRPLTDYIAQAMAPTRFALALITVFAGLAATLAAVGLYGVLSNLVRQRVTEIGVRMAFGAQPLEIFRMVVGQGVQLSAIGIAIGLVAALLLTRAMTKLLVGVTPNDPLTFVTMVLVFLVITAVACWIPARRAAGVEPNVALRGG
jgi:putative ABC transport system permease protein